MHEADRGNNAAGLAGENPNQRTCFLVAELAIKLGVRAPRTNKKAEVIAMMKRAKGAASRIVEARVWHACRNCY